MVLKYHHKLLTVCHNVGTESLLQLLSKKINILQERLFDGENGSYLVCYCSRQFWGNRQCAFFDTRVLHPMAPSYCCTSLATDPGSKKRIAHEEQVQNTQERGQLANCQAKHPTSPLSPKIETTTKACLLNHRFLSKLNTALAGIRKGLCPLHYCITSK